MAKIWFCFEGDHPTLGEAKAERPLAELVGLFRSTKDRYLGDEPTKVRFGKPGDPLGTIRGYQHVVVEVEEADGRTSGWKAGHYYSSLTSQEASENLGL